MLEVTSNIDILKETVCEASKTKSHLDSLVNEACRVLDELVPSNHNWFFQVNSFRLDVDKSEVNTVLESIEEFVGCSYCYAFTDDYIVLIINMSTLCSKLS